MYKKVQISLFFLIITFMTNCGPTEWIATSDRVSYFSDGALETHMLTRSRLHNHIWIDGYKSYSSFANRPLLFESAHLTCMLDVMNEIYGPKIMGDYSNERSEIANALAEAFSNKPTFVFYYSQSTPNLPISAPDFTSDFENLGHTLMMQYKTYQGSRSNSVEIGAVSVSTREEPNKFNHFVFFSDRLAYYLDTDKMKNDIWNMEFGPYRAYNHHSCEITHSL